MCTHRGLYVQAKDGFSGLQLGEWALKVTSNPFIKSFEYTGKTVMAYDLNFKLQLFKKL